MAEDTKTREIRPIDLDNESYLRIKVPKTYAEKLNKQHRSHSALDARDKQIFDEYLKDLADNFDHGDLSEDRAESPWNLIIGEDVEEYAKNADITKNQAFDKLVELQQNARKRGLASVQKSKTD